MTEGVIRQIDSDCKLKHVMNWLSLFVDMHSREIMGKYCDFIEEPRFYLDSLSRTYPVTIISNVFGLTKVSTQIAWVFNLTNLCQ